MLRESHKTFMNQANSTSENGSAFTNTGNKFFVVGIGASAGGIEALQRFFERVPADSGMAYIVILHLSPDHDSQLAEILQLVTQIPVSQVHEAVKVAPNHIYVVSPNQHLTLVDDVIQTSPNMLIEDRRAPVDIFFRTLSESHKSKALCVILSGTGANGSMGLKHVKERGGAVFVQNPHEAQFGEMPRNAIATNMVDSVMAVAEIPMALLTYKNNLGTIEIPDKAERRSEQQQRALREIFTQLRVRTGHDFSNYKRPTLLRRIERRIHIRNLPNLPAYATFIREDLDESQALLKDLLISVTNFFRDKQAFEALEQQVLPKITANKTAEDQVRIWVAGCATGEEAYSIAMLCAEQTHGIIDAPKIEIFATDIDEAALAHAREGFYTLNDAADVSPERLHRFFTREERGYRIRREIREMVLFAVHNVINDPPFSHLDLAMCRNMLIYFNQTAQEQVIETFHFALNPGSYLFLGISELADRASDLYSVVSREHHIYKSRYAGTRTIPIPKLISASRYELSPTLRLSQDKERRVNERITYSELHQQLLEHYGPPSLVVNEEYDIVHVSQKAGRYLHIAGGELSKNLLKLIRDDLRLEIRSALYQAVQQQSNVEAHGLKVRIDEQVETINLHVQPVLRQDDIAHGFILVIFEPVALTADVPARAEIISTSSESVAHHLEAELIRVKTQLRTSAEQYEYQTEELKISNEELQATNEELRSTAEELETSKEELQSINEELRTVNQELKTKIEEEILNRNNLQNLIDSAEIGTIFLDRGLRIQLFTPAVRGIFNLIPNDFGRPLSDITNQLIDANLMADAQTVLDTLHVIEREVHTQNGSIFLMHVLPYRTSDDHINGVVLTFVNISKLKKSEESLRESREHLRLLIESIKDYAIFALDPSGVIKTWNTGAEAIFGWAMQEAIGQLGEIIFTREDRAAGVPSLEMKTAYETGRALDERFHIRKNGEQFFVSGIMSPLYDGDKLRGFVKIAHDLTARNLMEQELRDSHELLEHRVRERTSQLNETNEARRELLRKMVTMQEEERARIAHDLHDRTAQHLTTFIYSLSMLKQMPNSDKTSATLTELLDTARNFMEDLHTLVQGLRPPLLDMFGLTSALQDYAQKWSTWSGIPTQVESIGIDGDRLPAELETTIYRIVQEGLTNIARHATNATLVNVTLVKNEAEVTTMIEDNGPGFDLDALNKLPLEKRRLGLLGMQERAELMGGSLIIESQIGTGTVISLQLPLPT